MPLDIRFRLSLYLTLAAANLCLCLAVQQLVPEVVHLIGPLLVLLLVAFLVEGRWTLPVWGANILGVVIAAGWGAWVDQRIFGDAEPWHEDLPLAAMVLPHVGPLLMCLVLVKLFRPKQGRDFWSLHGLGLLEVALACVLGSTPYFGIFLAAYLPCALWSLALFSQRGGTQGTKRAPEVIVPQMGRARGYSIQPVRWALGVTAAAVGVSWMLPRGGLEPWDSLRLVSPGGRAGAAVAGRTGGSDQIDLNKTGWVEVDEQVAFVVTANDAAGAPKLDLSLEQRWRGPVLDNYRDGLWAQSTRGPTMVGGRAALGRDLGGRVPRQQALFDLGPRQFFLTYEVDPRRAGGLFLAEPIILRSPANKTDEAGVLTLQQASGGVSLFRDFPGTLVPLVTNGRETARYRQVTVPPDEANLGPPSFEEPEYRQYLSRQPVPALTTWTLKQLQGLAARAGSGITEADLELQAAPIDGLDRDHPSRVVPLARQERIARALTAYLAQSSEYTYSLELRRQDYNVDPTLDFLANVKVGNCDRYAGGLALMLRSLGIPSRIVKGFRGTEPHGDGSYEVRNNQAHSWVEISVSRSGPQGQTEWHWLTLDPTPSGDPIRPPLLSLSRWWDRSLETSALFWKNFIIDYSSEYQHRLWSGLVAWLLPLAQLAGRLPVPTWLLGLAVLPIGLGFLRLAQRWRGRRKAKTGKTGAFFGRLLAILARRRGLRPASHQTPHEFAEAAASALGAIPWELKALPVQVADLYYRVRFGDKPLTKVEAKAVDGELARLDAALAER
jgi:transglutaminase-like putative cysteine protease